MGRYTQTLSRIGAGYSVFGALVWLLWPKDMVFADNPEVWFVLGTAFVFWHFVEFKLSEEISASTVSENDVRVARELAELHAGELRFLLKDTDLWTFIDSDVYSRLGRLCDRWERGTLLFHNRKLNRDLSDLMSRLSALGHKIAQDTTPEMIGGKFRTGYKPYRIVSEEDYARLQKESKTANAIAWQAWEALDRIVRKVRRDIPEMMKDPIG